MIDGLNVITRENNLICVGYERTDGLYEGGWIVRWRMDLRAGGWIMLVNGSRKGEWFMCRWMDYMTVDEQQKLVKLQEGGWIARGCKITSAHFFFAPLLFSFFFCSSSTRLD